MLPSLIELRENAKSVGQDEPSWTSEEFFEDVFSNGAFHEEHVDWPKLADRLSVDEVGELILPVVKYLLRSGTAYQAGVETKALINFYETVCRWQARHLKSPEEIRIHLQQIREILFKTEPDPRGVAYRAEITRVFSLVEFAILRKMGIQTFDLEADYDHAGAKFSQGSQR